VNIDILGSKFTNKLKTFKNFPYSVSNSIEGQSVISLFSAPIPTDMSEIDTTELDDITFAYRDLNKTHAEKFRNSESPFLLVDLYSELDDVCEIDGSFFSPESVKFLKNNNRYRKLSRIEKFRAFQENFDKLSGLISEYDKVILVMRRGENRNTQEYLDALYKMISNSANNLLKVIVEKEWPEIDDRDMPLEIYNDINLQIKKFRAKDYDDQFLFAESLENDTLSIFLNHIEKRYYIYELYKNGSPVKETEPTTDRMVSFKLTDKGNYRVRVNLVDESISPRFSRTYEFEGHKDKDAVSYDFLEIDENIGLWKLSLVDEAYDIKGYVGNPYTHPNGLNNYPVYHTSEVPPAKVISASKINQIIFESLYARDIDALDTLKERFSNSKEALFMIDFVIQNKTY